MKKKWHSAVTTRKRKIDCTAGAHAITYAPTNIINVDDYDHARPPNLKSIFLFGATGMSGRCIVRKVLQFFRQIFLLVFVVNKHISKHPVKFLQISYCPADSRGDWQPKSLICEFNCKSTSRPQPAATVVLR